MKEQNVVFALVIVKPATLNNHAEAVKLMGKIERAAFPGLPIVFVAQDQRGIPTYLGRPDITRFLATLPIQSIGWKEYQIEID